MDNDKMHADYIQRLREGQDVEDLKENLYHDYVGSFFWGDDLMSRENYINGGKK